MRIPRFWCLAALMAALLSTRAMRADEPSQKIAPTEATNRGKELFEKTILPTLVKHCYACHSKAAATTEGGLELDSPSGLLRGGDTGPMLKAHQTGQSHILQMLRHRDDVSGMPPEEKLPDDLVAVFEEWIRLGAPDSREDSGPTAKEQRIHKSKQHWAFQPPRATPVPVLKNTDWPHDNMIDRLSSRNEFNSFWH